MTGSKKCGSALGLRGRQRLCCSLASPAGCLGRGGTVIASEPCKHVLFLCHRLDVLMGYGERWKLMTPIRKALLSPQWEAKRLAHCPRELSGHTPVQRTTSLSRGMAQTEVWVFEVGLVLLWGLPAQNGCSCYWARVRGGAVCYSDW